MLKQYYPYAYVPDVFHIDYEALYRQGIRGIMFDIDNTLVHHGADSTPEIDALLRHIQSLGIKTLMLSNNSEERIQRFLKNIDSLYVYEAEKPAPQGYLRGVKLLELPKEQIVVVGDQIFTDIVGANRAGLASILVHFIQLPGETKIGKRLYLEKLILQFYQRSKKYKDRLAGICKKGE